MRLLGFLALATPVVLGILLLALLQDRLSGFGDSERSVIAALAAATIGVCLTTGVYQLRTNIRLRRLVKAAEKIADGDYTVGVSAHGGGLETRLAGAINRISASLADTHDRATIDRLTGVFNRQALLAELFSEVERASRYDRPLSVAFVDIDQFKVVNDTYGHGAGDIVLRGVAQLLAVNLRASDRIGRYGGEEFMLILTETSVDEGAVLAEKLRALVERERFVIERDQGLSVTISIGIVGGLGDQLRMEALVRDADAAMYSAKSLGRNQTYVFAEPNDDARVPRAPISARGRARAVEIGRQAREAATAALMAVLAPLPQYRGRPSALITSIVEAMARTLQLPDVEVERIRVAALLHDIGKLALPDEILDKPGPLTSAEWRSTVQHPRIGQVILEQAAALEDAIPIILHHHERFAGHGYPYGLRATEIPLGARIVAIADAYDAMVNDRPYKGAMSHQAALDELRRHAGTQFDPELVTLFCDLYAVTAPEPDPAVVAFGTPPVTRDRRIAERATSAAGHRQRASRAMPATSRTMASDGEVTIDLGARPAAAERADLKRPANPEGRGRAAG
jgi:diguanylate cyclase (GGDEF)-like protein/putative nucleotidyltransferase with HDIG domain